MYGGFHLTPLGGGGGVRDESHTSICEVFVLGYPYLKMYLHPCIEKVICRNLQK